VDGVLIRMQLALMRNSMTGTKAFWTVAGGLIGLLLAIVTIGIGATSGDLLALVFLMWTVGWLVGPLWSGGSVLRPDHFALLPMARRRLAAGLLAAGLVGVGPAVTAVAFTSIICYGTSHGPAAGLVAVPAALMQLVAVVLLSRLASALFGALARSRVGAVVTGGLIAALMVVTQSGWMIAVGAQHNHVLDHGLSPALATTVRALPSGWGIVAVESAGRGQWWAAAGLLLALAALIGLLFLAWARTLGWPRRSGGVVGARRLRGVPGVRRVVDAGLGGTTGAVVAKELRTWWRDPQRITAAVVPILWAVGTAVLPLTFATKGLLPWAGPAIALMAVPAVGNLYAQDGTALWLTLLTGSQKADVRGRQLAFLLVYGPIAIAVTVAGVLVSGLDRAWPYVAALVPALLGGGAGIFVLSAVVALVPGPDAHKRPDNPLDRADATAQSNVLFWLAIVPALPALAAVALLGWAGVAVGIATGIALGWVLGTLAVRRLEQRGPDLLLLMRTGRGPKRRPDPSVVKIARRDHVLMSLAFTAGPIALFPQGIVALTFLLTGADVRSWFLALHLSSPWNYLTAGGMIALGLILLARGGALMVRIQRTKNGDHVGARGASAHGRGLSNPAQTASRRTTGMISFAMRSICSARSGPLGWRLNPVKPRRRKPTSCSTTASAGVDLSSTRIGRL